MAFSKEELIESKKQIESLLHKLRRSQESLQAKEEPNRYRSQITLTQRRIRAFEIALELIDEELEDLDAAR